MATMHLGLAEANHQLQQAQAAQRHAVRSHDARRVTAMIQHARCLLPVRPDQLNQQPWLLNCPNGTLDLRGGEFRPHAREDFLTGVAPVEFHADAPCPVFAQFLAGVFPAADGGPGGDSATITFLQRFLGSCLTGDTSAQCLPIFWGDGANGKSTLLNVIAEVLGPHYAGAASPELLLEGGRGRHPTELADLFGKRLVVAVETDRGRRLNESLVKQLTGGDKVKCRRMREDFWEFTPTHKLILATNHRPVVEGTDHAIWRRLCLVPFRVAFWNADEPARPGEERPEHLRQNRNLPTLLRVEYPGVLAWLVRGCRDWQSQGLAVPPGVAEATWAYRAGSGAVANFLAACCTNDPAARVRASELYRAYLSWHASLLDEDAPESQRAFGKAMTDRGYQRQLSNGVFYSGLMLRSGGVGTLEGMEPCAA